MVFCNLIVYILGVCINPSLALINHSCDPNYSRLVSTTNHHAKPPKSRIQNSVGVLASFFVIVFFLKVKSTEVDSLYTVPIIRSTVQYMYVCKCKQNSCFIGLFEVERPLLLLLGILERYSMLLVNAIQVEMWRLIGSAPDF